MNPITVEKTAEDSASKSLHVTVPVDRVREPRPGAEYYAKRARLPGFRPGKAPDTVVRKRFGDAIRQTVLEEVIRESWETAKTSESLKPITDPSIRNLKFEEGSPIEFELHVEVRPELKLERMGGFRAGAEGARRCTDERGRRAARAAQEHKATWIPVEGAKPAPGQMVRVEVAPIENGVPAGAAARSGARRQSGHPGAGGADHDAAPRRDRRGRRTVPGRPSGRVRRGQTRGSGSTLHEVKRQELPPLDDALARETGDFETLDALRAAVRQDLEREAAREADAEVRRAIMVQLVEANRR